MVLLSERRKAGPSGFTEVVRHGGGFVCRQKPESRRRRNHLRTTSTKKLCDIMTAIPPNTGQSCELITLVLPTGSVLGQSSVVHQ